MWTISNFPVNAFPKRLFQVGLSLLLLGLFSCHIQRGVLIEPQAPSVPQDAPQVLPSSNQEPVPAINNDQLQEAVELESVYIGPIDPVYAKYASPQFLATSSSPLALAVTTQAPIDMEARTSWPVIELNGKIVKNSRVVAEKYDMLIAFLPDRSLIKSRNTVAVVWVGNEELTRTKTPLVFGLEDIKD